MGPGTHGFGPSAEPAAGIFTGGNTMERSALQNEVAKALLDSKAVDFDVAASVLAKYAPAAAERGEAIGILVNWRHIDLCIPVDPYLVIEQFGNIGRAGLKG